MALRRYFLMVLAVSAGCGSAYDEEPAVPSAAAHASSTYQTTEPTVVVVNCRAGDKRCVEVRPDSVIIGHDLSTPAPVVAMPATVVATPAAVVPASGIHPAVEREVADNRKKLRRCYQKGLDDNPTLSGTVRMTVHVDADGEVDEVHDAGSTIMSRRVVDCVIDVFEGMDFGTFVGRRFVYPLDLQPAS